MQKKQELEYSAETTLLHDTLFSGVSGVTDDSLRIYDPEFNNQFGAAELDDLFDEHSDSDPKYNKQHQDQVKKIIQIIRSLQNFALASLINIEDLAIDKNKPLDLEFIGSSSRVYEGVFEGQAVAIKLIHPLENIVQLRYLLTECLSLKVAKERANVGPGFYGLVKIGNRFGIVMDKLDGQFLTKNMYKRVNNKSIETFKDAIHRLAKAGFAFIGDAGQLLIKEDGEIQFCDIQVIPLDEHGQLTEMDQQYLPEASPWYLRKLHNLRTHATTNIYF